ncbi:hypothetical protein [Metabacillus indicus]
MQKSGIARLAPGAVLTEELSAGAGQCRKAEPTVQAWQSDKKSME